MRARIVAERRLVYEGSPTEASQRPAHVRAGSGLAWTGDRMVVVQDDADYIAVIEGSGSVAALPLRGVGGARFGKDGRGHLNLEAVLSAKDWKGEFLLAFGSGLAAERRCVARVRLSSGDTELALFETRQLYSALEELPAFATSELNIEGAALLPKGVEGRDGVRLFHRGNRPPRPGDKTLRHLSGTVDFRLDALLGYLERCRRDPAAFLGFDLHDARRYDLDEFDGAQFTFSDAAGAPGSTAAEKRAVYIALAERDQACVATALGVIEPDGNARYTIVVERDGQFSKRRAEGMVMSSPTGGYLVIQEEDEGPATLATLEVTGL